jgi:Transglycosylase SLT domain
VTARGFGLAPRPLAIALGAAAVVALAFAAMVAALGGESLSGVISLDAGSEPAAASAQAEREIPPHYLRLYMLAAERYGLDWPVLAAIGKVECDHGRDPDPSCTREGAVNSAGAGGPMQFLASTWASYGVNPRDTGPPDRWDPEDAIFSAARYLRASGAPSDYRKAIFAYNHAAWYVSEVEAWASRYERSGEAAFGGSVAPSGGDAPAIADAEDGEGEALSEPDVRLATQTHTLVRFIAGERARLQPGDGHLALVPADVPAVVQAMVVAGNEMQDLPYGPGGHPDPLGAAEEDCSSTVNYVLYRSGVRPLSEILRENPLAQDYRDWGAPGPGRWVTIYATEEPTPHVFMTIAGLRLDTVGGGEDEGPNRDEGGPRWRILDHIPTWAHWSMRHPPGL